MGFFDEKIKGRPPAAIIMGGAFVVLGLLFLLIDDPRRPMTHGLFRGLPLGILAGVIAAIGLGILIYGIVRTLQGRNRI